MLVTNGNKPFLYLATLSHQPKLHCLLYILQRCFMKQNLICIARVAQNNAIRIPKKVSCYWNTIGWVNLVSTVSEPKGNLVCTDLSSVCTYYKGPDITVPGHNPPLSVLSQPHWYLMFLSINSPWCRVWGYSYSRPLVTVRLEDLTRL